MMIIKKQAVGLALLSSLLLFFSFPLLAKKSSCEALDGKSLKKQFPSVIPILEKISSFFESGETSEVIKDFHPRLKISEGKLNSLYHYEFLRLGKMKARRSYAWRLASSEERSENIPCEEGELSLLTHYGYPFQLNFWYELKGESETNLLLFSLVPKEGRFYIGSFQVTKWTHKGKDFKAWTEEALQEKSLGLRYLKLDIARKLIFGGSSFTLEGTDEIKVLQNQIWKNKESQRSWYQAFLPDVPLAEVDSIFNSDGIGLKFSLNLEDPQDLKGLCHSIKNSLAQFYLLKSLSGVRCEASQSVTHPISSSLFLSL